MNFNKKRFGSSSRTGESIRLPIRHVRGCCRRRAYGRRVDLKHLHVVPIEPREKAQEIIADATFAVMRHTLR